MWPFYIIKIKRSKNVGLINLDKCEKWSQSRLTPINLRRQVPQDWYLAWASLHPQEGSELSTPLPDKNLSPTGWSEVAEIIMQWAQANHVTTFENTAVPEIENSDPHMWLEFCYTLPMRIYDTNACQRKKFKSSEDYRLAFRGDLVPFRSFKPNVKKKAVVFCPGIRNKSLVNLSPLPKWLKRTIEPTENCNRFGLSQSPHSKHITSPLQSSDD
jgi:hypothetical protein